MKLGNVHILPTELLRNPPSMLDGVDHSVEQNNRIFLAEFIAQAGAMLNLKRITIAAAQITMHRFYYSVSMTRAPPALHVVLACIYLGTKIEEDPRKVRDIFTVVDRLIKRRHGLPLIVPGAYTERDAEWREGVRSTETIILKALGFKVYIDHPHKLIVSYLRVLNADQQFIQVSWNFLNDSFRTDLCVRYQPEVIATSCIFLAARVMQRKIANVPWWELFDATYADMEVCAATITELYTRDVVKYIPVAPDEKLHATNPLVPPPETKKPRRASRFGHGPTDSRSSNRSAHPSTSSSATSTAVSPSPSPSPSKYVQLVSITDSSPDIASSKRKVALSSPSSSHPAKRTKLSSSNSSRDSSASGRHRKDDSRRRRRRSRSGSRRRHRSSSGEKDRRKRDRRRGRSRDRDRRR